MHGPNYRLANLALIANQPKKTVYHLIAEMRLSPDNPNVLISIATMFIQIQQFDYALNCLLRAGDIATKNASIYYYLGVVSTLKENFEDAAHFFRESLEIDPENIKTLQNLSTVYFTMGMLEQAEETINRITSMKKEDTCTKNLKRKIQLQQIAGNIKTRLNNFKPSLH